MERTKIGPHVPNEWIEEAEESDVTRSEWFRRMIRSIECCHGLEAVDPDDIPVCEFNLKLSSEEILTSDYSLKQLLFVQAVYNAQQRRYDPREYDLRNNSMSRLQEYVGIESEEIENLLDVDILRKDTDYPHRMYSVSPDGRVVIGESYRVGVDFGHGKGDLDESTEHVFGVDLGKNLVEQYFKSDPASDVETVSPYHELQEGELPAAGFMGTDEDAEEAVSGFSHRRLDVAGLDADGNVVVAVEVERINNDLRRAAPDDYDKMAPCDPEEAIWIAMTQNACHDVLAALNEPLEGEARVEKTYSGNTPPQQFNIDTPGLTALYDAKYVRDSMLE
jgi:hypothetical protein